MAPEPRFDDWERRLDRDGRDLLIAILPAWLRARALDRPVATALVIHGLAALLLLGLSALLTVSDSHGASNRPVLVVAG